MKAADRKTAIELIKTLRAAGASDHAITFELNRRGLRPSPGREWSKRSFYDFTRAWIDGRGWIASKRRMIDGSGTATIQDPSAPPKPETLPLFALDRNETAAVEPAPLVTGRRAMFAAQEAPRVILLPETVARLQALERGEPVAPDASLELAIAEAKRILASDLKADQKRRVIVALLSEGER